MATIKSYTDLKQSQKLTEILPIESADMIYPANFEWPFIWIEKPEKDGISIPAWSLSALLNVLEFPTLENDSIGKGKTGWMVTCYTDGMRYETTFYDNPIDACYELILKLHELNLL